MEPVVGRILLLSPMPPFDDAEVYRSILEILPVAVCVVDLQQKIVLWSDGAEKITGHPRHEVIGHSYTREALLPCDQPGCEESGEECPLVQAIKMSHTIEGIGYLRHKAGHEIPVRIRAVPVHNAHGSIIGAVETFEDDASASSDHHEDNLKLPGFVDELTGLANHAMMQSHLRETLGTFHEVKVPFSVLYFRVDGLRRFRANFGAEAAELLLGVVARTLEGALWKTDFVGRWSEDQFMVILNGCREDVLHAVRERIRRMLAGNAIDWWGERRSLPILIGEATAQSGDTLERLMERAEKSLSVASAGRSLAASASGNATAGVTK
jgi:diguanylate cyclase (GGDEF)-like protein/PAS domain S-box-containing protein